MSFNSNVSMADLESGTVPEAASRNLKARLVLARAALIAQNS